MPAPPDSKVAPVSANTGATSPNVAALESVKFDASSTGDNVLQRGPEHAVEGAHFWEAATPPPGWWSVDLESPRAIQTLTLRVFDGVLDPSTFQLQALADDDDDSWMTIFKAENETGTRGELKTYSFSNARCFRRYRLLIERTMGGPESETHPFLQGVGLFEENEEEEMMMS